MNVKLIIAEVRILVTEANTAAWQKNFPQADEKLREAKLLIGKYLDKKARKAPIEKGGK